jgi:hypothetical protein
VSTCLRSVIVAVGLLTERDLGVLGHALERIWPVEDAPSLYDLLEAIDETDRLVIVLRFERLHSMQ